jgi:hypothetical protein
VARTLGRARQRTDLLATRNGLPPARLTSPAASSKAARSTAAIGVSAGSGPVEALLQGNSVDDHASIRTRPPMRNTFIYATRTCVTGPSRPQSAPSKEHGRYHHHSETRETGPVDPSARAALRYVLRVRGFLGSGWCSANVGAIVCRYSTCLSTGCYHFNVPVFVPKLNSSNRE